MKTKTTAMIAAAALGGLIIGTAGRASASPVTTLTTPSISAPGHSVAKATVSHDAGVKAKMLDDDTKGKHDCKGKNDCKGLGGCKTGDNGCKAKNSCKGKGGCDTNHPKKDDASKL